MTEGRQKKRKKGEKETEQAMYTGEDEQDSWWKRDSDEMLSLKCLKK